MNIVLVGLQELHLSMIKRFFALALSFEEPLHTAQPKIMFLVYNSLINLTDCVINVYKLCIVLKLPNIKIVLRRFQKKR